ncbi:MAG: hypothetical protein R3B49_11900 [Phycisphaerales bacterium]
MCPRASDRGSSPVVFNRCIYNHQELRAELEAAGHQFRDRPFGHRCWCTGGGRGDKASPELADGMFATVLWSRCDGRVRLSRDRYGEKPLAFAVRYPLAGRVASRACPVCWVIFRRLHEGNYGRFDARLDQAQFDDVLSPTGRVAVMLPVQIGGWAASG